MKPIRIVCWVLFLVAFATAGAKTRKKICQPKPRAVERLIVEVSNPSDEYREEVIELPLDTICQRLGTTCDSLRVLDGAGLDVPYQWTHDGKLLIGAYVRKGGVNRFVVSSLGANR